MKLLGEVSCFIAIMVNLFVFIKVYSIISNSTVAKTKLNILIFFILSIFSFFANYLGTYSKSIILFLIVLFAYKFYFKENCLVLFFKTIMVYVILFLSDFLVFGLFLFFRINANEYLVNLTLFRALSTFFDSFMLLFIFILANRFLQNLLDYILKKFEYIYLIISFLTFLMFYLLTHFNITVLNLEIFWISILLMILLLFLCIVMIFQYFKNKSNEEEQKALLELMNEYELILDKERINRHEMLNNLVVLKSFKDKATIEYEKTLEEIIESYQDKKSLIYSNLYKLPSGVKGIIYYKIPKIRDAEIVLNLFSSSDIEKYFEKLDSKIYFKVCKILGIVLDNAIEAASVTEDKFLLIDIYKEDCLVIYIENSFINNIDLNNINLKGVSSKGKNRGYGLYIVKKLLQETKYINFDQYVLNDKFVTVLKIINNSI